METKFVRTNTEIEYPVGDTMLKNKKNIMTTARTLLEEFPNKPLTLWTSGSSGSIIAGMIVALATVDVKIIYVYKDTEPNHDVHDYFTPLPDSINVIVDDFTSTFNTIRRILTYMDYCQVTPDCLCVVGAINGKKVDRRYCYKFSVIIASYLWYSKQSINESGLYDLGAYFDRAHEPDNLPF